MIKYSLFKQFIYFVLSLFFILQGAETRAGVANIIFLDTENYVLYDKVLHQVVKVKVTDEIGNPIPFVEVHFFCSDTVIADFIFPVTLTDTNGLAVSIIQSKLSADQIISPPSGLGGRTPIITAKSEGATSSNVPLDIIW